MKQERELQRKPGISHRSHYRHSTKAIVQSRAAQRSQSLEQILIPLSAQ